MYQFPDPERQWMYTQLLGILRASSPEEREQRIQVLATHPEQYLDLLIEFSGTFMKSARQPAIWVIQAIGYPNNAKAIYDLIDHFDDVNSPARDDAGQALLSLTSEVLLPHLLHYFWVVEEKPWGWERIEHVCRWFRFPIASREDVVGMGPYLAYLLTQGEDQGIHLDVDPEEKIRVLEKIGAEHAAYALPVLLNLIRSNALEEIKEQAWQFIQTFDQQQLAPYVFILQDLEQQRKEKEANQSPEAQSEEGKS